jgi:uncharacterized ion transporter superfamily protein YfcC
MARQHTSSDSNQAVVLMGATAPLAHVVDLAAQLPGQMRILQFNHKRCVIKQGARRG